MNKDAYSSSSTSSSSPSSSSSSSSSANKPSPAPPVFLPPMPLLPITSPATLRKCKMYPARGRDIFIASYPKSGTTWTQNIVYQLLVAEAEVKRRGRRKKDGLSKTRAGKKGGIEDDVHENGNASGEEDKMRGEYPPPFQIEHISEIAPFFEVNRTWQQEQGGEGGGEGGGGGGGGEERGKHKGLENEGNGSEGRGEGRGEIAPLYRQKQGLLGRRVFNTHLRWEQMPEPLPRARGERDGGSDDGLHSGGTADANKQREEEDEGEGERAEPCYLYLVRDGRDACVSFYHHSKSMASKDGGYEGGFEEFFEDWIEGRLPYGRWVDHVVSWLAREGGGEGDQEEEEEKRKERGGNDEVERGREESVLVVRYEDLKRDLIGGLKRIAKHCRISLRTRAREGWREGEVEKSAGDEKKKQEGARTEEEEKKEEERMWEAVKEKCSFEYMVDNRKMFEPRSVTWIDPAFKFIRKGEVGDHKVHFTEEQLRRFAVSVKEWLGGDGEGGGGGKGERVPARANVVRMLEGGEGGLDV